MTNIALSIDDEKESILTMLASEEVLKKDWNNKKDEAWNEQIKSPSQSN